MATSISIDGADGFPSISIHNLRPEQFNEAVKRYKIKGVHMLEPSHVRVCDMKIANLQVHLFEARI